jgi:hypothetical protein
VDKYIYKGEGYFAGVPARDMSAEEWAELPKEIQKAALKAGLYEKEKEKSEVKDA